jgi:hypothetical protein
MDAIVALRRDVQRLEGENARLCEQVSVLQGQVVEGEERQQVSLDQFELHYARLEDEYQSREQEVMVKYMAKLEEGSDRHEEDLRKQAKFADFLQNKLNAADREKELLSEEVARLVATLTSEEQKLISKSKAVGEEVGELRK